MTAPFDALGFGPGEILLPPQNADWGRWSVVACDQYTSQPDYWQRVEDRVGEAPSSLRLVLPESRLEEQGVEARIEAIHASMEDYLDRGYLRGLGPAMVYVERTLSNGRVRRGLVGQADLERYDFHPGASSLIRATEGTVLERIPPRVKVRQGAPLELPHVMLLTDDPGRSVIEPLAGQTGEMELLYDFELMEEGGHIRGWRLTEAQQERVGQALAALAESGDFQKRYNAPGKPTLLFAVGDGNHSLATAKTCYEADRTNPRARYALVELVNLHDPSLEFEPIHRVLFGVEPQAVLQALGEAFPGAYEGNGEGHVLRYIHAGGEGSITVPRPESQLAVGTLQSFLDRWLKTQPQARVDYIHGDDVTRALAVRPGNLGFLLPPMGKEELFPTVIFDGVLPRKTFSMGEARDKRFYLEAKRIK